MAKLAEIISNSISYLKDVKAEANKVVWPSKAYVIAATSIVLIIIMIISVLILFIDFGFSRIFEKLLNVRPR